MHPRRPHAWAADWPDSDCGDNGDDDNLGRTSSDRIYYANFADDTYLFANTRAGAKRMMIDVQNNSISIIPQQHKAHLGTKQLRAHSCNTNAITLVRDPEK